MIATVCIVLLVLEERRGEEPGDALFCFCALCSVLCYLVLLESREPVPSKMRRLFNAASQMYIHVNEEAVRENTRAHSIDNFVAISVDTCNTQSIDFIGILSTSFACDSFSSRCDLTQSTKNASLPSMQSKTWIAPDSSQNFRGLCR